MSQYELNLRDYVRIFHKRKTIIIAIFSGVTILSVMYSSLQHSVYQSSVTIKMEERNTIAGLITEWVIHNPGNVMESQTKFIKGYTILQRAGIKIGLLEDNASDDRTSRVVAQLQAKIETERVGQTNMIKISASGPSAKSAMDLVNAVAVAFMEENVLEKAKQFSQARQFVQRQLQELERRLRVSELRLRESRDLVNNVKLADSIQQRQIALELELEDLLQKFTEKYPRVVLIREQLKDINKELETLSLHEMELSQLMREIDINKKLYAMLKEKLEEIRITEAQKVGDISIVNPATVSSAPVSGNKHAIILVGLFMGLLLGVSAAFIIETMDTSINTIEDVERMIKLPILGVIPSVENEVRKKSGIVIRIKDMIFPTPKSEAAEREISLIVHHKPRSPIAEAYRNIQTNLKLNKDKKTILVTSSGPREGKSTVVTNLGIVMSQAGLKTLLVSCDLRRPVIARHFGIKKFPGLNELITGTVTAEEVLKNITDIFMGELKFDDIRKTPGLENIWLLPSGNLPSNPVEILKSGATKRLIDNLREQFDVIIFDSPPVLPVTDASLISQYVDCVVIVYEIGRTSREALGRAKVQLEAMGAKIVGVILNHTQPQIEGVSMYPYYASGYRYDSNESKKT